MSRLKLAAALTALRPLCMRTAEGIGALHDYATLAEQSKVLGELLPGLRKDARMLGRGKSGLRVMEERLLKKLEGMIPVNEAAVDWLGEDEPAPPLRDIPFQPWFPHGNDMAGEELDHFPEGERLACLLSWGATPDQIATAFELDEVPDFTLTRYEDALANLGREEPPACFMADALRVASKDTRCYWFDGLCECGGACGCGLPWDIRDIRAIARQRPEADAIAERLVALSRWVREDPRARVPQILRAMGASR